jgi:hypothetical protein
LGVELVEAPTGSVDEQVTKAVGDGVMADLPAARLGRIGPVPWSKIGRKLQ